MTNTIEKDMFLFVLAYQNHMVLIGYDKEKHVYFNGFDEKA